MILFVPTYFPLFGVKAVLKMEGVCFSDTVVAYPLTTLHRVMTQITMNIQEDKGEVAPVLK
jgi:hypothetical protein